MLVGLLICLRMSSIVVGARGAVEVRTEQGMVYPLLLYRRNVIGRTRVPGMVPLICDSCIDPSNFLVRYKFHTYICYIPCSTGSKTVCYTDEDGYRTHSPTCCSESCVYQIVYRVLTKYEQVVVSNSDGFEALEWVISNQRADLQEDNIIHNAPEKYDRPYVLTIPETNLKGISEEQLCIDISNASYYLLDDALPPEAEQPTSHILQLPQMDEPQAQDT